MQIENRHLQILHSILKKHPFTFYAFGSRVKGTARKFSDLDLCYKENINDSIIVQLEGELEDSDLPFKIELINLQRCSADFKKAIENDLQII